MHKADVVNFVAALAKYHPLKPDADAYWRKMAVSARPDTVRGCSTGRILP